MKLEVALVLVYTLSVCSDAALKDNTAGSLVCASGCKCYYDKQQAVVVDCAFSNLNFIPNNIPPEAQKLDLSNNHLTRESFHENIFTTLISLQELDLSHNKIIGLPRRTFNGLHNLKVLKLHLNQLTFSTDDMPTDIFVGLDKLEELIIFGNQGPNSSLIYRDDVFKYLHNLSILLMDGLPGGKPFGKGFSQLTKLQRLCLYGTIDYLANNTFEVFQSSSVTELDFKGGKIYDVEPMTFAPFSKLRTLQLNNNVNLGFPNVTKAWYGLQFTKIEEIQLKTCVPLYKGNQVIDKYFYQYLNLTRLKDLRLSKNDITYVKASSFSTSLPYLEVLTMQYNRLTNIHRLAVDLARHPNLKLLAVSHQDKRYPYEQRQPTFSFNNMDMMEPSTGNAENQDAMLTQEEQIFMHNLNRQDLSLERPQHERKPTVYDSKMWLVSVPPKLETALMQSCINMAISNVPKVKIFHAFQLKYLDFSGNGLTHLIGPCIVYNPNNNVSLTLQLSENGIVYLDKNFLTESIQNGLKVTSLDLKNNRLGLQIAGDSKGEIFHYYKDLEDLNLAYNGIKEIPKDFLLHLSSLENLNFTGNSLRLINFTFSHLNNLRVLDFSFNLFAAFSQIEMEEIDNLNSSFMSINLTGNPLTCSCDTLDFLQWMYSTKVAFPHLHSYECAFQDTFINLSVFYTEKINRLRIHCSSKDYVKAASSAIVSAFVGIVLAVIMFTFRWDIRFIVISWISRGKKKYELEDCMQYEYDAFVAYHDDSKDWIVEHLIPNLEGNESYNQNDEDPPNISLSESQELSCPKLHLCLHYRDFDPGTRINQNIVDGIVKSRKTLIILTHGFLDSTWCKYETEMAHVKCFEEGKNSIIPIQLEEISVHKMSENLRRLVKRYSYLTWPTDKNEQICFWKNVRKAINTKYHEVLCACGNKTQIY